MLASLTSSEKQHNEDDEDDDKTSCDPSCHGGGVGAIVIIGSTASDFPGHGRRDGINHYLIARTKLHLDPDGINNNIPKPPLPPHTPALTVIAQFLCRMNEDYIKKELTAFYGQYNPDRVVYCLTVPAMWEDEQKDIMRQAAVEAGIIEKFHSSNLFIVTEPEAATHYALKQTGTAAAFDLTEGDLYMVCDAGGGTVDLTIHEVIGDGKLRELDCRGATCGSSRVDDAFYILLEEKLGERNVAALKAAGKSLYSAFNIEWLSRKHNFTGDNTPVALDIPLANYNALPGPAHEKPTQIDFSIEDFQAIFEGPARASLLLIEQLLGNHPGVTKIVLVGGFATSEYLRNRIAQWFSSQVRLVNVNDPQAAVVKGAVLCGMEPTLEDSSKPSTSVYAQPLSSPPPSTTADRFIFEPLATKGTIVTPASEFVLAGLRVPSAKKFTVALYASYADKVPETVEDSICEFLGKLEVQADRSVFTAGEEVNGKMTMTLGEIKLVVQSVHTGAEAGARIAYKEK
ncbi:Heat shock 70 kDa protein 12A [Rhizophlyctis rosea]|nr:Heat shock 70 kDa protein 12A [Rhizophlyctis rosea]